jgi:hypothetical protein
VIGVTAGSAAPRETRLARLAGLELRRSWLLAVALALQLLLGRFPSGWRGVGLVTSTALVGLWLAANLPRRPSTVRLAIGLLAAGWALNVAVMAPNHGMPVSRDALDALGAPGSVDVAAGNQYKHVALDDDTVLPWLGDVVAVPPVRMIVSAGDVVLAAGLVLLVAGTMAASPVSRRPRLRLDAPSP